MINIETLSQIQKNIKNFIFEDKEYILIDKTKTSSLYKSIDDYIYQNELLTIHMDIDGESSLKELDREFTIKNNNPFYID